MRLNTHNPQYVILHVRDSESATHGILSTVLFSILDNYQFVSLSPLTPGLFTQWRVKSSGVRSTFDMSYWRLTCHVDNSWLNKCINSYSFLLLWTWVYYLIYSMSLEHDQKLFGISVTQCISWETMRLLLIVCFYMTSQRWKYWQVRTKKSWTCWWMGLILWEFSSFVFEKCPIVLATAHWWRWNALLMDTVHKNT